MSRTQQPPSATPPAPVVVRTGDNTYTVTAPRTPEDLGALRLRRNELSNQLQSAASRRADIAEELKQADGAVRTGLEERMAVLDRRILQLESDLAETGQAISNAPAGLQVATESPLAKFNIDPDTVRTVSIMFMMFVLTPIALSLAWAIFRRTMKPSPKTPQRVEGGERLERLENAVDAIAVEIERISEGQRFVTKLLTEAPPQTVLTARHGQPSRIGAQSESE